MKWLIPWHPMEDDGWARKAEEELRREVAESHPMFGLPVRALGSRQDCDDVLFAVDDGSGRVAVVHLTFTYSPPDRPPWPSTQFFPSLEHWIENEMKADNDDWGKEDSDDGA